MVSRFSISSSRISSAGQIIYLSMTKAKLEPDIIHASGLKDGSGSNSGAANLISVCFQHLKAMPTPSARKH
jgi:hypothetical protein